MTFYDFLWPFLDHKKISFFLDLFLGFFRTFYDLFVTSDRELSVERDLTLLSIGVAAYAWDDYSYSS